MFSYHVQSSDLEVHYCEIVFHLLLFDCRALLLADRPEDVGQRLVHLRHVLVVQIVDVDGDLGDRKLLRAHGGSYWNYSIKKTVLRIAEKLCAKHITHLTF